MTRSTILPALALLMLMPSPSPARYQAKSADESTLTVVRGRIVCPDTAGNSAGNPADCGGLTRPFALEAIDGRLYKFLETDSAAAMFVDPRVRQRSLQITARQVSPGKLEIVRVRSVREGKLYDIYYFCEVCNITAYAPGPCPCCRDELEFRERPVPSP